MKPGIAMRTIVNKTFEEMAPGDTASAERRLQAGDVRAWAAAFGEVGTLAGPAKARRLPASSPPS